MSVVCPFLLVLGLIAMFMIYLMFEEKDLL